MGRHEPIVNVVPASLSLSFTVNGRGEKSQKDLLFKTVIIKTRLTPQCWKNLQNPYIPSVCQPLLACWNCVHSSLATLKIQRIWMVAKNFSDFQKPKLIV